MPFEPFDHYERSTEADLAKARDRCAAENEAMLLAINKIANEFRQLLRAARNVGDASSDGSFGLNTAVEKVTEAELWANKEIRGRNGVRWP